MTNIYNSALQNGTKQFTNIEPVQEFDDKSCAGVAWDLRNGKHHLLLRCDVIYAEPPWPHGLAIFDERAGKETGSYDEFCEAFRAVWDKITQPKLVIASARLQAALGEPEQTAKVLLNGASVTINAWGALIPSGKTNLDICRALGKRYHAMGDICCGYGIPLLEFQKARSGNRIVGLDYDAHAIGVFRSLALGDDLS